MTVDKTDLTKALRALASEARPGPDDHPAAEMLVAYHEKRLSDAEAEAIQEHLALCPECARLLLDLASLPEPGAGGGTAAVDEEVAAAWRRFEQRVRSPGEEADRPVVVPFVRSLREGPAGGKGWRFLAAVLALAAVGLGLWGGRLYRRVEQLSAIRPNVPVYDLEPVGEASRGVSPREGSPGVPGALGALLLLNGVSDLDYPDYELVIRDARAALAPIAPSAASERYRRRGLHPNIDGVFTVSVPPGALPPGRYEIHLYGLGRGEPARLAAYELTVRAS